MKNEITNYSYDSSSFENEDFYNSPAELAKNALFQIQRPKSINQHRVKSVMNLNAQFAALCESRTYQDLINTINTILDEQNRELSNYEKAIIELQFLYGLRISEVLNITYADVNYNGSINIKGLKGSNNRLVYPVKFRDFWLFVNSSKIQFPSSFNRFYFYRLYRKKGIYEILGNNKKESVTHILRYNFIVSLIKSGKSIEEIQQLLGHKSINSTLHYVGQLCRK